MAVPKKKTSASKSKMRRANWNVKIPGLSKCSNCGSSIKPHKVCPSCGYYKKREVVRSEVA